MFEVSLKKKDVSHGKKVKNIRSKNVLKKMCHGKKNQKVQGADYW